MATKSVHIPIDSVNRYSDRVMAAWADKISQSIERVHLLKPHHIIAIGILITGEDVQDIARVMCRSKHTVDDWVKDIYRILQISNRQELVAVAIMSDLVDFNNLSSCIAHCPPCQPPRGNCNEQTLRTVSLGPEGS
jgi:hypothetical protein